jgi:hypothetical protein
MTTIILSQAVGITRKQLRCSKTFRSLCQQLLEVNEKICDAKLAEPGADCTPAAKKRLQEAFDAEVSAEIEALIGSGAVDRFDFEAIETVGRRQSLTVVARVVEQLLNADTSDHVGPSLPCSCDQLGRLCGPTVE